MLKLNFSGQIKKDLRRCKKRGYNMSKFENVVDFGDSRKPACF